MKKSIVLFGMILLLVAGLFAQAPNWSVNPNAYQFNMTVTAVALINCNELSDENNQIAAFIGEELHGMAHTSVDVDGRLQANLVIYSNNTSGEKVYFKIYNDTMDSIFTSVDTVVFQSDQVVGSPALPFNIANNHPPENILLTGGSVDENVALGTLVGTFTTVEQDSNKIFNYSFTTGSGDSNNSAFTLSMNELFINEVPDYEKQRQYSVRILSSDNLGCGLSKSFQIDIKDMNDLTSSILMSDTSFNENIPISSTLATLKAVDEDSSTYTFTLVPGTGDEDNASFNIVDDKLISNDSLDYERKSIYKLRIQVLDSDGGIFQQMFVCTINDLNEAPIISDQEFSLPENNESAYEIGILEFFDEDNAQLHTFEILGAEQADFSVDPSTGILSLMGSLDFEKQSEYNLQIRVSDNGKPILMDSSFVSINVLDVLEEELASSNFISPNGDGKNDRWVIQNVELYSNYQLHIYSASGAVVFSRSSNYNNDFDGSHNGQDLPDGIYYYLLESRDGSRNFKGIINLIR